MSRPLNLRAASKAVIPRMRAVRTSKRAERSSPASSQNVFERLPPEILIKILSYLDAAALFTISHINKLFYQLANDNILWNKIYIAEFGRNKNLIPMYGLMFKMDTSEVQGGAASHWKYVYFMTVAVRDIFKWRGLLQHISYHTGLPSQTKRILRNLSVTWELMVTDRSGNKSTLELSWSQFFETSVTLCWSGGSFLPNYQQMSTFQLYSVRRIALNCPGLKKPGWKSLMAKVDVQTLTNRAQVIGQDRLVELVLLQPGIAIGVWKGDCSVAFIMFTVHFNKLVEGSIMGYSACPSEPMIKFPFDDIDPEYGLHGYQLHIVLHNTSCELMSGSFSQLFCRKSQISDGLIKLTAISETNLSQHIPLSGNINLSWQCAAIQGTVENCCIMSLTLLDEFRNHFRCICSPLSMELDENIVSYDYSGERYLIHYQDSDTQVKMKVVCTEEQKQFVLISLVVYLSVCSVNRYFSRDY